MIALKTLNIKAIHFRLFCHCQQQQPFIERMDKRRQVRRKKTVHSSEQANKSSWLKAIKWRVDFGINGAFLQAATRYYRPEIHSFCDKTFDDVWRVLSFPTEFVRPSVDIFFVYLARHSTPLTPAIMNEWLEHLRKCCEMSSFALFVWLCCSFAVSICARNAHSKCFKCQCGTS